VISFRYHVVSIIAVFLALALGIVVGTTALNGPITTDLRNKVDSLNKLLNARTQLANLLTYMDGKGKAEDLIGKLLQDPELLKSLAAAPKPEEPAS